MDFGVLSAETTVAESSLSVPLVAQSQGRYAAKHKGMAESIGVGRRKLSGAIAPPAYPFTGPGLFRDLRARLSEPGQRLVSFRRLAQLIGHPRSTTHHWFEVFDHPQLAAFMCLLERLPIHHRHAFIEAHCRVLPTLEHSWLSHDPAGVSKLQAVLRNKTGLTVVTGAEDQARTFVVTALGYSYSAGRQNQAAGVDLSRPNDFVPLESLIYIDPAIGSPKVREVARKLWPRVATSASRLIILNKVWSAVPELHCAVLRLTDFKHVVVGENQLPDMNTFRSRLPTRVHEVTTSKVARCRGCIQIAVHLVHGDTEIKGSP